MHTIRVASVSAALLALIACSSHGAGSITAPSSLTTASTLASADNPCSQGNCIFVAEPFGGAPTRWHGDTAPSSGQIPQLGHPGHLTVTMPMSFNWGATLRWDKFHHGGDTAECTITSTADPTWTYVVPNHCGDGSGQLRVFPTATTEYTLTDTENPQQSRDKWQVSHVTVVIPTTITGITATWEPAPGYQTDDPVLLYSGGASGPLNNIVALLQSPNHAHCGLGGQGEYTRFSAQMALNSREEFVGSYDAQPGCVAAKGTFTLTREQ
jgi:hypothetical protein